MLAASVWFQAYSFLTLKLGGAVQPKPDRRYTLEEIMTAFALDPLRSIATTPAAPQFRRPLAAFTRRGGAANENGE